MSSARAMIALAVLLVGGTGPLMPQEPVDRAMIARIREEGLQRSRVEQTFSHLTDVTTERWVSVERKAPALRSYARTAQCGPRTKTV